MANDAASVLARRRRGLVLTLNRVLARVGLKLVRSEVMGFNERGRHVSNLVFDACDGRIEAGPFAGTRLARSFSWGDANMGAVILGYYEQQLHPQIEELIAAQPDVIVNVGAAEGTYAIGLARRLPRAHVIAADIVPESEHAIRANAQLNEVADRVTPVLNLSTEQFEEHLSGAAQPAVVLDCEGCEEALLDPNVVPSLGRSLILVEVHEDLVPGVHQRLLDRFEHSHVITDVIESGRNPHEHELLRRMPSIDKWLLLNEWRSSTMHWLWCIPRTSAGVRQPPS